eukprot:c26543_g2_i3 orf=135-350(+)
MLTQPLEVVSKLRVLLEIKGNRHSRCYVDVSYIKIVSTRSKPMLYILNTICIAGMSALLIIKMLNSDGCAC